jgi:hypothetical protein
VDEGGTQLSISAPVDLEDPGKIWGAKDKGDSHSPEEDSHSHSHGDSHDSGSYKNLKEDLEDVQILLILGILAIISAVLIAFMTFGCRSMPFRRIRSEKEGLMGFRDDGTLRVLWNKARSMVPGRKKSWYDPRRNLLGRERGDSIGEADGDFRIDER